MKGIDEIIAVLNNEEVPKFGKSENNIRYADDLLITLHRTRANHSIYSYDDFISDREYTGLCIAFGDNLCFQTKDGEFHEHKAQDLFDESYIFNLSTLYDNYILLAIQLSAKLYKLNYYDFCIRLYCFEYYLENK